jgi:hypothetical protein
MQAELPAILVTVFLRVKVLFCSVKVQICLPGSWLLASARPPVQGAPGMAWTPPGLSFVPCLAMDRVLFQRSPVSHSSQPAPPSGGSSFC